MKLESGRWNQFIISDNKGCFTLINMKKLRFDLKLLINETISLLLLDEAWVTLATNDPYAVGALVLAKSLHRVKTSKKIVIMVTSGVSQEMRYIWLYFTSSALKKTMNPSEIFSKIDQRTGLCLWILWKISRIIRNYKKLDKYKIRSIEKGYFENL